MMASEPLPSGTNTPGTSHIEAEQRWANAGENLAVLNFSEKIIEEKERHLRECIQNNYSRIKDVERELSGLQMQLKLSTGPKRSALMMLRKKIELQNERVLAARERQKAAKKVFEATDEALKEEDAAKERLCSELNMLVQQSAHAQLEKLEQLTARLERMNQYVGRGHDLGIPAEQVAAAEAVIEALKRVPGATPTAPSSPEASSQQAAAPAQSQPEAHSPSEQDGSAHAGTSLSETPQGDDTAAGASARKAPQQPDSQQRPLQRQDSPGRATSQAAPPWKPSLSGSSSSSPADRQRQNTGAVAARSRHVSISPRVSGSAAPAGLPPAGPAPGSGRFQGFDT
ncbi:g8276 [Coccomyxa viridis]|uniref:G8276 protein n=1 Tax=Coccomyxa viridis TaxID=1274662 RepID=A0ABP1G2F2_9CHLO